MTNKTIPDLPDAAALDGTEPIETVQSGVSVKATAQAVAGAGGMTLIASGSVAVGVGYLDLALPSGYAAFRLQLIDLRFDQNDLLGYVVSDDGGVTFYCDTVNFDSYNSVNGHLRMDSTTYVVTANEVDSIGDIVNNVANSTAGRPLMSIMDIDPGSADSNFQLMSHSIWSASLAGGTWWHETNASVLLEALGRMNVIRIQPSVSEDTPPSSGTLMTIRKYLLWGVG